MADQKIDAKAQMQLLMQLIEALGHASGSATGLAQRSGNPAGFMVIRDALELTKEGIMSVASRCSMLAPRRVS